MEVIVGCGEGNFLKEKLQHLHIPCITFPHLSRGHNPFAHIFFIFELKKFLRKEQFDIVHFNSSNTLVGALAAKLIQPHPKTIFTFRGMSLLDRHAKINSLLKMFYWIFFKCFLACIDEKIFVSSENLAWAKKIKLVKKGRVIYNGIDQQNLHFLERSTARSTLSRKINISLNTRFIIGSIGRLAYPKNYEFIINTFPAILKIKPNALGIVIGSGGEKEKYLNLIKKQHLEHSFFLIEETTEAYTLLRAFDLFVLPSKYEGLSLTLIEALCAERPILASKVGGNGELLPPANLFTLDSKEDFLQKFGSLPSTPPPIDREQFSIPHMVKQYLEIYNDLS
jgi:glycosyltransferase involved in cell wall biosynthesis